MVHSEKKQPALLSTLAIGLTVLLGLFPLGLYLNTLGNVPSINSSAALEMLSMTNGSTVLIDVRSDHAYQERHIVGSVSLPLAQILELDTTNDLPIALQGKTFLLVCDLGLLSARSARHLSMMGVNVFSIRGGMQDWGRAWPQFKDNPSSGFELAGGVVQEPFRGMTAGEQAVAALALLWIKPTYMLLSASVSLYLVLRSKAADLRLLGWSLLVFLIGEVFCAINYVFLKDSSYFAEYMHSYSMAIAFGLAAYALMEGLDQRLIHFSGADKRCALLPVCGQCVKYQPVRCGVGRIAQYMGISMIILAVVPLLAPFSYTAYNTQIGPIFHYYTRPIIHQWFEARFSPILSILLSGLALLVMQRASHITLPPLAQTLFCGGAGFLGFGMFRVTLGMVYAERLVWATFWEEATELMFVAVVMYILWIFRHTLLPGVDQVRDLISPLDSR
jgi:rhodanese-related sulfurtransferase